MCADRELLEATLYVIDLLTDNLPEGQPIKPHPMGLAVIDVKQRLRKALAAPDLLSAPIVEWEERAAVIKDKQALESELSALVQRAALLEAYISRRWNTGCGDQGHAASAKHANRTLAKIRRALGFSYPDNTPLQITP